MSGTRSASSYSVRRCPFWPWSKNSVPWSLVTTTTVSCARPSASSRSSISFTWASHHMISPSYSASSWFRSRGSMSARIRGSKKNSRPSTQPS